MFSDEDTINAIVHNSCFPERRCLEYRINLEWLSHQSPSLAKALLEDPNHFKKIVAEALSNNRHSTEIPIKFYLPGFGEFNDLPEIPVITTPQDLRQAQIPSLIGAFGRISTIRREGDILTYVATFQCRIVETLCIDTTLQAHHCQNLKSAMSVVAKTFIWIIHHQRWWTFTSSRLS